jgi:stage V sporulation protein R
VVRDAEKPKEDLPDELIGDLESVPRLQAKDYMEDFVNPEAYLDEQRRKKKEESEKKRKFPEEPDQDALLFLMQNAPLTKWQRNVLGMIRDEAYYYAPQGMTKIMNEGWASYWHAKILTGHPDIMLPSEVIDFADRHSGVTVTHRGRLNPYKLGIELFRHIEWRWDTGRFGKEWDQCDDMAERANWNRPTGKGREKIFEVRKHHNDVTFLDEYLTPEFCAAQQLFTFAHNPKANEWQIATREFAEVKRKLLSQLTNMGQPVIVVDDADFQGRSELLLTHRHEGVDLDERWTRATMQNLFVLWKRPVHVASKKGDKGVLHSFDGKEAKSKAWDPPA